MKTTPRITAKGSKSAVDASKRALQVTAKLINRTIKNIKAALKAALMTGKAITALIIAGGWIAVMIIIIICAVALIVSFVSSVNTLSYLKDTLDEMKSRGLCEIKTAFDMDMMTNNNVRNGFLNFLSPLDSMDFKF